MKPNYESPQVTVPLTLTQWQHVIEALRQRHPESATTLRDLVGRLGGYSPEKVAVRHHRFAFMAWLRCFWRNVILRPLPPLLWEWKGEAIAPRWWMATAYCSFYRREMLMVAWPLHWLVMAFMRLQDRWSLATKGPSRLDEEIKARVQIACAAERVTDAHKSKTIKQLLNTVSSLSSELVETKREAARCRALYVGACQDNFMDIRPSGKAVVPRREVEQCEEPLAVVVEHLRKGGFPIQRQTFLTTGVGKYFRLKHEDRQLMWRAGVRRAMILCGAKEFIEHADTGDDFTFEWK